MCAAGCVEQCIRKNSEGIDFVEMKITSPFKTPIGWISITEEDDKISEISIGEPVVCFFMAETKLISDAKKQLNEYFAGKRKTFDLPVAISGTDFQMSVWEKLSEIPYGETRTYKQVAEMAGSPASYRAVGSAAGKNPVPIIVPCHRVIASGGSMSGYALGADAKKFLIELEASHR